MNVLNSPKLAPVPLLLVVTFALAMFPPPLYSSLITLYDGANNQLTLRGSDFVTQAQFGPVSPLPVIGTLALTGTGASASADYSYTDTGIILSNVQFSLDPGAFAAVDTTYRLIPHVDLTYTISGSLQTSGGFNSPTLWIRIQDITAGEPGTDVSNNFKTASGVINKTLTIPAADGLLQAGRTYRLDLELATDTNSVNNTHVNANGAASITFIPEPMMLSLMGLGCLGALRRRRMNSSTNGSAEIRDDQ